MVRSADERRGFKLFSFSILRGLVLLLPLLLTCCVDSAPGANDLRRRGPAGENSKLHGAVKSGNRAEVERLLERREAAAMLCLPRAFGDSPSDSSTSSPPWPESARPSPWPSPSPSG